MSNTYSDGTSNTTKTLAPPSHSSYITRVLEQYGMKDCNPVKTPALKTQQVKTDNEETEQDFPYREAVGSLLYVANSCRPDIAQATHHAARFVNQPSKEHVHSVKRILRYLKGTINVGITFKNCDNYQLHGYADADFASSTQDARSTTGYVFITSGPISWRSRRQQITALSTTEAEINALAEAAKEATWLATMLSEIGLIPHDYTVKMFEDNAGCLALVHGKRTPARTRHLAVRIGYLRDLIDSKRIDVIKCATDDMVADPFTKPLGHVEFTRKMVGLLTMTTSDQNGRDPTNDDDIQSSTETYTDDDQIEEDNQQGSGRAHHPLTHSLEGEC